MVVVIVVVVVVFVVHVLVVVVVMLVVMVVVMVVVGYWWWRSGVVSVGDQGSLKMKEIAKSPNCRITKYANLQNKEGTI